MTNQQVINEFLNGNIAHSLNLSTDGSVLYSYHYYPIAWRDKDFKIALRNTSEGLYSRTTAKHFNLLFREAMKAHCEIYSAIKNIAELKKRFTV